MSRGRFHLTRRAAAVLLGLSLVAAGCTDDGDGDGSTDGPDETRQQQGTVLGDGDTYEATIRRTEGGVPHITAADVASAAFGQGWASGEDRACDLADQVVKIEGQRAKWFGRGEDDANVKSDLAWRAIGIRDLAGDDWETVDDEVRRMMTAYTDGWNAHLEHVGVDDLPGWCRGEEWVEPLEPVQVYAYARSIALQASSGALVRMIGSAQPPGAEPPTSGDAATPTTTTAEPGTSEAPSTTAGGTGDSGGADEGAAPPKWNTEPPIASNGWAIGSDRSEDGGGMLVANPHFPWEGELRFWEVHLTVPGEVDMYGVQLSGLPGIGIGFNDQFGWTHTVSAGNRFTAYRLELVPDQPTAYRYGDEVRQMTSTDVTIEVLGDDGGMQRETHTLWRSHYGPIIDFPGFGWSESAAITFRDANIDNDEFIDQYVGMLRAESLDDLIEAHREHTGVPLFNTIAVSADGRAWYADTSATPNLSDEAIAEYQRALQSDPIVKIARDNGAILLDGSDPRFEWQEAPDARDPGLVPFSEMPVVERSDYVFNANDSFWMANASHYIEGDHSPLHGEQRTARSPRTRENAIVLSDTSAEGPAGDDGKFSLDELADASLQNVGYTARALREEVVARCTATTSVEVPAATSGPTELPAGQVDLTEACAVLDAWDGVYDLDRKGPALWRELMTTYDPKALLAKPDAEGDQLWANRFDPADPVNTPSGLAPAPESGPDPVLVHLARAVQILQAAEIPLDAPLGDVQFAVRNGTKVPIHGGGGVDGVTNVVGMGRNWSILDPTFDSLEVELLGARSSLARMTGAVDATGYLVSNGTSFLLALAYTDAGPRAKAFLTYSDTEDREDPEYTRATERFSKKQWRDVLFDADDVEEAAERTVTVKG